MSDKTIQDLKVDAHIAVLHTKVDSLVEKQKELTERVRANEKVVAAVTLLGTVVLAVIGAGYFSPKAEACSPRLDGGLTICPGLDIEVPLCKGDICPSPPQSPLAEETETPDYYSDYQTVTVYDTREPQKWDHGSVIQRMRDWKAEQERTPIEDSINNALAELEYDYGRNGSTEQE